MHHLAVLGRERAISVAELESVCGEVRPFGQCAIINQKPDITNIGGVLKVAKIITEQTWTGWADLSMDQAQLPGANGKLVFGVSYYGPSKFAKEAKRWTLELKKSLRATGVRAVMSDTPLSAAQLKFNQILDKGFELIIAVDGDKAVLALTEQFQDIDWYSRRDYDRPARSAKVGMLPPKLAQMMINLAKAKKVYDPFCGTGVVLQEALLMDKEAAGSDIEGKMVDFTMQNLDWIGRQVEKNLPPFNVSVADARAAKIPEGFTVVAEGYLGPPLSKHPAHDELLTLQAELTALYSDCLNAWLPQLESGQRLCLAVPCWQNKGKFTTLPLIDQMGRIGYNLVRFKNADSRHLIYARPDQIVGRQLLVLEKP